MSDSPTVGSIVFAPADPRRRATETAERGQPTTNRLLEMRYIGACALLGRLAAKIDRDDIDSRYLIEAALADCRAQLPGRFKVLECADRSLALEPVNIA